jgi:hypothetical protein
VEKKYNKGEKREADKCIEIYKKVFIEFSRG